MKAFHSHVDLALAIILVTSIVWIGVAPVTAEMDALVGGWTVGNQSGCCDGTGVESCSSGEDPLGKFLSPCTGGDTNVCNGGDEGTCGPSGQPNECKFNTNLLPEGVPVPDGNMCDDSVDSACSNDPVEP